MHKFLCWGPKVSPQVHILTVAENQARLDTMVNHGDYYATLFAFGTGIEYAVPATPEAMEDFALGYNGPWQERMRYVAACLALGRPVLPEATDDPEGGSLARLVPEAPQNPPSGDRVPLKVA